MLGLLAVLIVDIHSRSLYPLFSAFELALVTAFASAECCF